MKRDAKEKGESPETTIPQSSAIFFEKTSFQKEQEYLCAPPAFLSSPGLDFSQKNLRNPQLLIRNPVYNDYQHGYGEFYGKFWKIAKLGLKYVWAVYKWGCVAAVSVGIITFCALGCALKQLPLAPENYAKTVETGGRLEAKYLAQGPFDVKKVEATAPVDWGKFVAYYPVELERELEKYPVVLMVNGTGVFSSKYATSFERLASWGFIVIGNDDPSTGSGDSANATLDYLLTENDDPMSVFYHKVDASRVGLIGHSQGGCGVFNAIGRFDPSRYACAVSLSPADPGFANLLDDLRYEPDKTTVPTLLLASDVKDVIKPEGAEKVYELLSGPKAMALRLGADHGKTLYSCDGYVTAWFRWLLADDWDAARAFIGENAELARNKLYGAVRTSLDALLAPISK